MAEEEGLKYIVGIDSSTSCTGIALLEIVKNKLVLKSFKAIRTDESAGLADKSVFILANIEEFLSQIDGPYVIAIEEPVSRNMKITRMLSGLWGYIVFSIKAKFNKEVTTIQVKHIKAVMTGDGSAQKEKVIKYVNRVFKTSFKYNNKKELSDDDIADAIAIAYTYHKDNTKKEITNNEKKQGISKCLRRNRQKRIPSKNNKT